MVEVPGSLPRQVQRTSGAGHLRCHTTSLRRPSKSEWGSRVQATLKIGSRIASHAVADARFGDEEVGEEPIRVRRRELAPDLADVDVQVMTLLRVGGAPHGAKQPAARDDSAGICQKDLEQLVLARCEANLRLAGRDEAAIRVEAQG